MDSANNISEKTDAKKQKESFYLILSAFLFLLMCPDRSHNFVTVLSLLHHNFVTGRDAEVVLGSKKDV